MPLPPNNPESIEPTTAAPVPPVAQLPKKSSPILPMLLALLAMAAISAALYFFFQMRSLQSELASAPNATVAPSPSPAASSEPLASPAPSASVDSSVKTYTSAALGVSFNYLGDEVHGENFSVKETGDTVYVYSTGGKPEQGQYLKAFEKDSSDTLKEAIAKKFLSGYSATDCLVAETSGKFPGGNKLPAPASFRFAQITVPDLAQSGEPDYYTAYEKCPQPYAAAGGLAYFVMDQSHPSHFYFLSIGQYNIPGATDGTPWQNTLKFN